MSSAPNIQSNVLVILGASRSDGETAGSVDRLTRGQDAEVIDLLPLNIGFFDYSFRNAADDFLGVSKRMMAADRIVFATPVYWYAMSAPMKILFDRFCDLVRMRKPEGRLLAGKQTYLLANGTDTELPEGFEVPFKRTSEYLNMHYRGAHYLYTGPNVGLRETSWEKLEAFGKTVFRG